MTTSSCSPLPAAALAAGLHAFGAGRAAAEPPVPAEPAPPPPPAAPVGKRLPQDPRHRTTAQLAFDDARLATITAQVRYLGPQLEDDLNTLPIGAVVLVDARAARRLGRGFELFTSVQNLFDRRYVVGRAGVDTVGAPRTIEVGLAFDAGRP